MRILFLATWYPVPPDNGSKIRVYHLLRGLSSRHEVTLVSFAFDTARPENADAIGKICARALTVEIDPFKANRGSRWRRFVASAPAFTRPIPSMQRLVQDLVQRTPFDAAIASTEVMASYALSASSLTVKILEEHNSLTRWMWERYVEQKTTLQRLQCRISWEKTRRFEARLFNRFDLVTMVSEQDRQVTATELPGYRGSIEVIPNGVDCKHNVPGLAQPLPYRLVFNGALTYNANYDAMRYFLRDIYPLIKRECPQVSLVITGSYREVDLSQLALDNSVHLSGFVDDVGLVVAQASVCVVPLRQGGGTRLKILEAMALGVPVVCTSKGAEGLHVVNGRDLLIADEPAAFATHSVQLLKDAGLRERITAGARSLVEREYDWTDIGDRFTRLVEDVASTRRKS